MSTTSQRRAALLSKLESLAPQDTPAIRRRDPGSRAPLANAQERLWFLDQLEPGSPTYTMPETFRLTGDLDRAAFERAFAAVVDRHEILRSAFPDEDGEPYQEIAARPVITYEELPEEVVRDRLTAEAERGFDLARGPLAVARLFRIGEREHVLLLNMHHIVSDGWSMGVLLRDWAEFYRAELGGTAPDLEPLPIQYADYAVWQRTWLDSAECDEQLSYWRRQLAGAPVVHSLPTRARPDALGGPGAILQFEIPASVVAGIRDLGRACEVTTTMFLLAVFQVALARLGGCDDVVVGLPTAGRSRPETEPLIGFFVNTLVVRTDLSGAPTFRESLGRVREVALAAYSNQDVPFERLVEELRPPRSLGRLPVFQIMFSHENTGDGEPVWPGLTSTRLKQDMVASKFDLGLSTTESEYGMAGAFSYRTDLFDPSVINTLADGFQRLLPGVVSDPDRPIGTYPFEGEV